MTGHRRTREYHSSVSALDRQYPTRTGRRARVVGLCNRIHILNAPKKISASFDYVNDRRSFERIRRMTTLSAIQEGSIARKGSIMANANVTLPLLPLKSGVVLPGMVFTMALESKEAQVAVEAARSAGGHLLLVPHIEGRYAAVGVIAEVMERSEEGRVGEEGR